MMPAGQHDADQPWQYRQAAADENNRKELPALFPTVDPQGKAEEAEDRHRVSNMSRE